MTSKSVRLTCCAIRNMTVHHPAACGSRTRGFVGAGKFLVGKNGDVIGRYFSTTKPEDIEDEIVKALEA